MFDQRQAVGTLLERPRRKRVAKAAQGSPREQIPRKLPSLRERTRAENRDRYRGSPMRSLALECRCECARLDCRVRLPLEVERHRRPGDRFLVGLAHGDADIVVGVADHFFVVEQNGATRSPRSVAWREEGTVQR
jgi:hypothetical protein